MTIDANLETFLGKPVEDFDIGGAIADPDGTVYRLRVSYDTYDDWQSGRAKNKAKDDGGLLGKVGKLFGVKPPAAPAAMPEMPVEPIVALIGEFVNDPAAARVPALIIGDWGGCGCGENSSKVVVEMLVSVAHRLPNLRALFLGDIMMEESEVSWILQTDLSPLYAAFPRLEHLQVRGTEELSLGTPALPLLKTLIIEAGALPAKIIHQVLAADLPKLEHLELWLGSQDYGADSSVADLQPLLDGALFPNLRYLGLRDCDYADELAAALATAPILDRVRVLDLSLGTLSDVGGAALLASPKLAKLEKLDLHFHYLSQPLMDRFQALDIAVDLDDVQEADSDGDEVYRYVAVSE